MALTHGQTETRLYSIWTCMKTRCYNPNKDTYGHYGGRGISVCEEWLHDFTAFHKWAYANGYADELTIDRENVNGNYCPENCRWITMKEQALNRRERKKEIAVRNGSVSGFTGVSYAKGKGKWRAYITINGKQVFLGYHDSIEEAAKARRQAEIKYGYKGVFSS